MIENLISMILTGNIQQSTRMHNIYYMVWVVYKANKCKENERMRMRAKERESARRRAKDQYFRKTQS